jgi:hypothetical protein
MLIHSEIVGKSRKLYRCDGCGRRIELGMSYARCYGMAEKGDKPYALHYHIACIDTADTRKRVRKSKEKTGS